MYLCSIFEGGVIPYPKRDFLAEDETDDKAADAGATKRPNPDTVCTFCLLIYLFIIYYLY